MELTCFNCGAEFERQTSGKGYKRVSKQAKISSQTVKHLSVQDGLFMLGFPDVEGDFICLACFSLLSKAVRSKSDYDKFRQELVCKGGSKVKTEFTTPVKGAKRNRDKLTPVKTPRSVKKQNITVSTATSPAFTPMKPKLSVNVMNQVKARGFKQRCYRALEQSNYTSAINIMLVNSQPAQIAFRKVGPIRNLINVNFIT